MKLTSRSLHGFLGIGRMAEVLLCGMLQSGALRSSQALVTRTNPKELKRVSKQLKVKAIASNTDLADRSQVLWLGVKPYHARQVLTEIAPYLRQDAALVSMMAGLSTGFLQKLLGRRIPIVRLMPNTPAALGSGLTGVFFNAACSRNLKAWMGKALASLGEVVVCSREDELDAITGLSGSGVAFVYEFCRCMALGGVQSGLKPEIASRIAVQTFLGAADMLKESGKDPAALIAQVVSKGGTTEAGLKVLQKLRAEKAITGAVGAAALRAKTLRKENEG